MMRRVPGLRREELALLAGVSVGYYTRIEQGQARSPSRADPADEEAFREVAAAVEADVEVHWLIQSGPNWLFMGPIYRRTVTA